MESSGNINGDGLGLESKPNVIEVATADDVETTKTPAVGVDGTLSEDENSRLRSLAAEVVDQDELERNIGRQVSMSSTLFNCTKLYRLTLRVRRINCSLGRRMKEMRSASKRPRPTKRMWIIPQRVSIALRH